VLVDSSVWIPYLRGERFPEVDCLCRAMENRAAIWLAPPILQEVLQGADSPQRFRKWDEVLGSLPMLLESDMRAVARMAAELYARCRWRGVRPRSANDCLIAAYAIRGLVPLLHRDRDFIAMSKIEPELTLVNI
jgi:predicted nucleic acid-binding protein